MSLPQVIMYTDGSCFGNPGPGGYAAILISVKHTHERVVCGYKKQTTNNQMELMAVISGLEALKKKCNVIIYCDSTYVVKGITEWLPGWESRGFKNSRNQPIANQKLWQRLAHIARQHIISWHWVKAHAGNKFNERADTIAKEQAALSISSSPPTKN